MAKLTEAQCYYSSNSARCIRISQDKDGTYSSSKRLQPIL